MEEGNKLNESVPANHPEKYFIGRDKKTKCQRDRPIQNVRTRSHNIIKKFQELLEMQNKVKK